MAYQRATGPGLDSDGEGARVTWGLKEIGLTIVLFVAFYLVTAVAIVVPAAAAFGSESTETRFAEVAAVVVIDALTGLAVIVIARRSGARLSDLGLRLPRPRRAPMPGFKTRPAWGATTAVILLGLVAAYMSLGIYNTIVNALGIEALKPDEQIPEDYFDHPAVVAMLGVGVVIMAPLVEELFFRGFVFGGLRKMTGFLPAAIIAGLLFGSAHFQLGLVIPFGLIGFIFAYAYYLTGSLIPSMTIHFLFNLLSFVVLVLDPGSR